jgi:hypothetical protein
MLMNAASWGLKGYLRAPRDTLTHPIVPTGFLITVFDHSKNAQTNDHYRVGLCNIAAAGVATCQMHKHTRQ